MAKKNKIESIVRALTEPVIAASGLELVDVNYVRGPHGMTLRLILDKDGGVGIDDCVEISRLVGDVLDANDPIDGAYNLEVSSPGINRPLKKIEDFDRFAGQNVFVETLEPINGRSRFKGLLKGIHNGVISVSADKITFEIPYEKVSKARLNII
ncbi:MAG: ribosome maturation factor RimP [Dissulfurimicrobium sp.]|uniref:ribosome maturation factor RimP n=1 Tax=Dissulfurimicrobium sp. TaxID=2022436 RepID=UPI00404B14CD